MRRFRFSLRTWFVVLTLCCLAVFQGWRSWRRMKLEEQIFAEGSLIYDETPRHGKPVRVFSSSRGAVIHSPAPVVGLRDMWLPQLSRWSGGAVAFCDFDSIRYTVGNVPMPLWTNDVLATGELRKAVLRLNNEKVNANLLMKNRGLEELRLMGRADDPHLLRGAHRLTKLKTLAVHSLDLRFDSLLETGFPPNLEHLHLLNTGLEGDEIRVLRNCRKLKHLDLTRSNINLAALGASGLSRELETLKISGFELAKSDLGLLAECPNLTTLSLRCREADLRDMDQQPSPESLQHLEINNAQIDASTFRWFSRNRKLKSLKIDYCQFEDGEAAGIQLSGTVEQFDASDTNAGVQVAKLLADAQGLKSFKCSESSFGDDALAALRGLTELEEVVVRESKVTDASAELLGRFPKLKRLDIRRTTISDKLFMTAPHLRKLESLDVSDTKISSSIVDEIRREQQARWTRRLR